MINPNTNADADGEDLEEKKLLGSGCYAFAILTEQEEIRAHLQTKIEHIVVENDLVVVFLNGNGTHAGEFRGKSPTNKRVNIRSAYLYKIENEKIVEHWDVVDQLNLLHQTGTTLS